MAASHSDWYRALDPAKRQAIRQLHRINPYWNLVGTLFVLIWIATAAAMLYVKSWWVYVPGYVVIGLLIHGMANFMHEGIHGTLFRVRRWDRWYGFLMGAPAMFPLTAYGINHLLHHKYNRTERDPDEFSNMTGNRTLLSMFFYVWIVLGMVIYSIRFPCVAFKHATPRQRRRMYFERCVLLLTLFSVLGTAWWYGQLAAVAHVWLVPLAIAGFLGNVRGWAEHTLTTPGNLLTETRTVTSNRLFSFLNINLNYHLEHHLFPGVPWYNLPKVHQILRDDYAQAGASIYRSYTRFLYDAFRAGVHGVAPPKAA